MRSLLNPLVLLLLLGVLPHFQAWGETLLSGRVLDGYLQTPLKGVVVSAGGQSVSSFSTPGPSTEGPSIASPLTPTPESISTQGQTVETGADGKFQITVGDSTTEIIISKKGYQPLTIPVQGWSGEKTLTLKPSSPTLPEVEVRAYGADEQFLDTPGNLSVLTEQDLNRGDRINLAPVLNTVAGVRVDQAFMVDSRLSLRGVGLTANYGIRDIGIYVDNIPLNETDGFARLEGLDPDLLGEAQVIRGPASSLYGAGVGGDILFNTFQPPAGETSLEVSGLAGSYGLYRAESSLKADLGNGFVLANYGAEWFNGYVSHTGDYHTFATVLGTFYPSDSDSLTVLINQSDEQAQVASAETLAQFTQAPQAGVAADSLYNLHHNELWTRYGVTNHYVLSSQWENETSLYASSFNMDRAFADSQSFAALLDKTMQNAGVRTQWTFTASPSSGLDLRLSAGGEFMNEYSTYNYFYNNLGVQGALGYVVQGTEQHENLFFEADATLEKNTFLTGGLNINSTSYTLDLQTSQLNNSVSFTPTLCLRFALSHVFEEALSVYADVSQGFSPPDFDEMKNPFTGELLTNLLPELATQYEIGARGRLGKGILNYDLALYDLDASQELVQQTVAGVAEFVNAGGTNHKGVELTLSNRLVDEPSEFLSLLKPWVSYSYQHYIFTQYTNNGVSYAGNQLTGNPENQFNAGVDMETRPGFYLSTNFQFVDSYPITDSNSVWNNSFGLWNAKAGYRHTLGKLAKVDVFAGGENLLNQSYSAYVAFNATNGAYYEPGVGQSFYGGLNLSVLF
jgi:iron complex outermembrane receptor protein